MKPVYNLEISYENEQDCYIFLIHFTHPKYGQIKVGDIVIFHVNGRVAKTQVVSIFYCGEYDKYYCKEDK